jgi:hypothetical protein
MTATNQIKSQLARLLATENITVMHSPGAKTAASDVKNRNLILPVWQNILTTCTICLWFTKRAMRWILR